MPIDVTKPADDDFLNVSAAHIRANFQATKEAIEAHEAQAASASVKGHVQVDGTTIVADEQGVISVAEIGAGKIVDGQLVWEVV